MTTFSPVLILALILVLYLLSAIKILNEYERGVIFRLGKLLPKPKGPGIVLVFAPIDRMMRVSLRTVVLDVPPQDIITRDNRTAPSSRSRTSCMRRRSCRRRRSGACWGRRSSTACCRSGRS